MTACDRISYTSMVKNLMDNGFVLSEIVRKLANVIRIGKIVENDGARVRVKIGKVTTGWLPIVSGASDSLVWIPISKNEQVAVFFPYGETAQGFVLRSIHYNEFKTPKDVEKLSVNTKRDIKIDGEKTCEAAFKKDVNLKTDENLKCAIKKNAEFSADENFKFESKKNFDGKFEENFNIKVGSAEVHLSKDRIEIKNGGATISLSNDGIELSAAGGSIKITGGNISINAGGGSLSVGSSISINGSSVALAGSGASIDLSGSVSISGSSISTMPPVCKCAGGL